MLFGKIDFKALALLRLKLQKDLTWKTQTSNATNNIGSKYMMQEIGRTADEPSPS